MYAALHRLLADRKGGEIFVLFGSWHLLYMGLTVLGIAVLLRILRNKSNAAREKIAYAFLCAAFGLYIVDFFLMPLAYNEIDIEKLPFHVCTAMCVMSFLSCHIPFLGKYRASFALLGFVSNLVYLIYPAGVMWHEVHPVSYRVIQTLLFHSVMTVYGFLSLYYGQDKLSVGSCCRDAGVVAAMTLWAMLGNAVYNGNSENYSHFFNWFFVVRDPFYLLPENWAPVVMPVLNIVLFFAAELLLRFVFSLSTEREVYYDRTGR